MQKPATILIEEFRKQVEIALNNSNLPWWKIKDELEFVLLPRVEQLAIQEENMQRQAYADYLKAQNHEKLEKEHIKKGSD